jgi:hypothetical protein
MNTEKIAIAAVNLSKFTCIAGSKVTALRIELSHTRTGSKKNALLKEALEDAKAHHASLSRQADSAWSQANAHVFTA